MPISKEKQLVRQERVLNESIRLFVDNTIERVSMQMIADASEIGIATLFRYHATKQDLVIAVISYAWEKVLYGIKESRPLTMIEHISAIERLEFALDFYIDLFVNNKDLIKLNDNFNHYLAHENIDRDRLYEYERVTMPMRNRFHLIYEKAKSDGTIRTDLSENELIRVTLHTLMASCHHFASGFVWAADEDMTDDFKQDLLSIKKMILSYVRA